MGQGVPFQNDSSELLINMPSKKMSLNLDDDEEFWKWYQNQMILNFKTHNIYQDLFWSLYEIIFITI